LSPEEEREFQVLQKEEELFQQQEAQAQQQERQKAEADRLRSAPEADLGFTTRAKFALEPIESNRIALLVEKFGPENVIKGPEGDLFLNQNGEIRPVNTEGISTADLAELVGSAPEIAASVGLGAAGAATGLATGGTTSIPAALAGGAAGATLGSAVRQAASAFLGTPQVATAEERGKELAVSGALGLGGAGVGQFAGRVLKPAAKAFPSVFGKAAKPVREAAKRAGIKLTFGQKVGGTALENELALGKIPIFGRNVRKTIKAQQETIEKNLKDEFGDFLQEAVPTDELGAGIKKTAQKKIDAVAKRAGELFDDVMKQADDVAVDGDVLKEGFLKSTKGLGLFDDAGNALPWNPQNAIGATRDEFLNTQKVIKEVIDSFTASKAPAKSALGPGAKDIVESSVDFIEPEKNIVTATGLNNIRRSLDAQLRKARLEQNSKRILSSVRSAINDVTSEMLEAKSPKLAKDFRKARTLWAEKLRLENMGQKGGVKLLGDKALADEKVLEKAMTNTKAYQELVDLVGEDNARGAAEKFVKDQLQRKVGEDAATRKVETLRTLLVDKKGAVLKKALGARKFNRLKDNLRLLEANAKSLNPSETKTLDLITNPFGLAEGAFTAAKGAARKTLSREFVEPVLEQGVPGGVAGITQLLGQEPKRKSNRRQSLRER